MSSSSSCRRWNRHCRHHWSSATRRTGHPAGRCRNTRGHLPPPASSCAQGRTARGCRPHASTTRRLGTRGCRQAPRDRLRRSLRTVWVWPASCARPVSRGEACCAALLRAVAWPGAATRPTCVEAPALALDEHMACVAPHRGLVTLACVAPVAEVAAHARSRTVVHAGLVQCEAGAAGAVHALAEVQAAHVAHVPTTPHVRAGEPLAVSDQIAHLATSVWVRGATATTAGPRHPLTGRFHLGPAGLLQCHLSNGLEPVAPHALHQPPAIRHLPACQFHHAARRRTPAVQVHL